MPFEIDYVSPASSGMDGGYANISSLGFPRNISALFITICGREVDTFKFYNSTLLEVKIPSSASIGCDAESSISFNNITANFSFMYVATALNLTAISKNNLNPFLP
jgi:hypothetical protein